MTMDIQELDKRLQDAMFTYNREMQFCLDTFDQSHDDDRLTKDDMDEMSRQVFYTLGEFREVIVDYLKNKQ